MTQKWAYRVERMFVYTRCIYGQARWGQSCTLMKYFLFKDNRRRMYVSIFAMLRYQIGILLQYSYKIRRLRLGDGDLVLRMAVFVLLEDPPLLLHDPLSQQVARVFDAAINE